MYANLKALRESLHMKQDEFGASVGVKKTTYQGYETGQREPRSDFWIAVAETYRVSIDYLMGFTDDPKGTKYGEEFHVSQEEKQLVTAWRNAEEKDKRRVAIDLEDYGFSYSPAEKGEQKSSA